ncbi:MAG: response regulator [Caldilineaceae bacterium]|nr:response regulator [Caldilineaceae bacterium]
MTKILVVEDEAILREELVDWLILEGYEALGAEDGMVGVELALRFVPDLIICDILMPRLDGYGVLLEVHANPAMASIPFIFVTARVAHEDIRKGMELGADDYITKPFTRLELLQAIQGRLAKRAAQALEHQKELAQLRQSLDEARTNRLLKPKLVSMFSHDFANSLTSILMTNSLLRDYATRMDEERRLAHLNRIEASTRLLLQMLDDLLILAQMEAGTLELESELLNAAKFFQRIHEDTLAIYGERYQILFESQSNHTLLIDLRLLRLIVANLIAHAVKTTPRGGVVRVLLDNQPNECILVVQEQCAALTEAQQARRAEVVNQDLNAATLAGTGLELAIVQQAVDLLQGTFQLTAQPDMGRTMTVRLPAHADEDSLGEAYWDQLTEE